MVTPYTDDGKIDYPALRGLIEYYVAGGARGLFAVCQSSEMYHLSLDERLSLSRACVSISRGRLPVVASGHVSDSVIAQLEEVKRMADTGVEAVVLVTNRFAAPDESDDVFRRKVESFLTALPDAIRLGFYECPYPYKRLLTPELMTLIVESGRFEFLKETSGDLSAIVRKLEIARGSKFKIFNANAASLLASLRSGAAGYSGVMANFQIELYSWLCDRWMALAEEAEALQDFLGLSSIVERQFYPVNALYYLSLEGLAIRLNSRRQNPRDFTESMRREIEQFRRVSKGHARRLGLFFPLNERSLEI